MGPKCSSIRVHSLLHRTPEQKNAHELALKKLEMEQERMRLEACKHGVSSLSLTDYHMLCGAPALAGGCMGRALHELGIAGRCSLSFVEATALLNWLEQHEQDRRPSGEDDIVRMTAEEFLRSNAVVADSNKMYKAAALVKSLSLFFVVGRDVSHLGPLIMG